MVYTPYVWPPMLAAVILTGIALYIRRHRAMPAARSFLALMGLAVVWTLVFALNVSTVTFWPKVLWQRLQILPIMFVSIAALGLAFETRGQDKWLTRRRLGLLLAVPVLALVLEVTSGWHTLFRYNFALDRSGLVPVLLSDKGPLFWVYLAYSQIVA